MSKTVDLLGASRFRDLRSFIISVFSLRSFIKSESWVIAFTLMQHKKAIYMLRVLIPSVGRSEVPKWQEEMNCDWWTF